MLILGAPVVITPLLRYVQLGYYVQMRNQALLVIYLSDQSVLC